MMLIYISFRLLEAFQEARKEEENARRRVLSLGVKSEMWTMSGPLPHSKPCKVCNTECYLSAIGCTCTPDAVACLDHVEEFCSCPVTNKILLARYTCAVMDTVVCNAQMNASAAGGKRYLTQSIKI